MDKPDKMEMIGLFSGGILGGIASWFFSFLNNDHLSSNHLIAISACIFFGIVAGLFGIYILKFISQNTEKFMPFLAMVTICAFVWKPILEASQVFVKSKISSEKIKIANSIINDAEEIVRSVNIAETTKIPDETIDSLLSISKKLIKSNIEVSDYKIRENGTNCLESIVKLLTLPINLSSSKSINAILEIVRSSNENDYPEITKATINYLTISMKKNEGQLVFETYKLLGNIANDVKDKYPNLAIAAKEERLNILSQKLLLSEANLKDYLSFQTIKILEDYEHLELFYKAFNYDWKIKELEKEKDKIALVLRENNGP